MRAQHTPGPLHMVISLEGDVAVMTADDDIVAECFAAIRHWDEDARDEALANARLYAAAPDLLEALEAEQEWQERDADGALDPRLGLRGHGRREAAGRSQKGRSAMKGGLNSKTDHYFRLSGVDCDGRPFVKTHTNLAYLRAFNVWKGRMYEVKDGRQRLLWTVSN